MLFNQVGVDMVVTAFKITYFQPCFGHTSKVNSLSKELSSMILKLPRICFAPQVFYFKITVLPPHKPKCNVRKEALASPAEYQQHCILLVPPSAISCSDATVTPLCRVQRSKD